jgi:hypothetical protein
MDNDLRVVTHYERLYRLVKSWAEGHTQNLAIIGRGGIGKSHSYEILKMGMTIFRGRTSAIKIYETVKDAPDTPIVFDDIQALMKDADCRDLLKQICDRNPSRTVRWKTRAIGAGENSFQCTARVMIALNGIPKRDEDIRAILTRFDAIHFEPTKTEILGVMLKMAKDPKDVEIFASQPIMPNLRTLQLWEGWRSSPYIDPVEELLSMFEVSEDIKQMVTVLETAKKGEYIKAYEKVSGKPHEAAKKDWQRKSKTAQQLVDAKKTFTKKVVEHSTSVTKQTRNKTKQKQSMDIFDE